MNPSTNFDGLRKYFEVSALFTRSGRFLNYDADNDDNNNDDNDDNDDNNDNDDNDDNEQLHSEGPAHPLLPIACKDQSED